ncbi:hypothetical protein DPMN_098185 [Dreissena polymorpha]|uniref:Uncharacterized protein n=1 Tax=Dreissena polymorpha TaxID=45954 RepID=A0A9D4R717_DREPO|nr:hypothetical protein DPMN_098185 [Dreissena polymorpha]
MEYAICGCGYTRRMEKVHAFLNKRMNPRVRSYLAPEVVAVVRGGIPRADLKEVRSFWSRLDSLLIRLGLS